MNRILGMIDALSQYVTEDNIKEVLKGIEHLYQLAEDLKKYEEEAEKDCKCK